eukprot:TRINITY_DN881_c0_g1_i1.p1 TRINITY_DN881_c0_g1~~TRINITY_DN881_c0_g1_i1.p1  ORF type:complete len:321 (+),score=32.01 TRINITY_DN881_c0_g1_i1:162-1124(+)
MFLEEKGAGPLGWTLVGLYFLLSIISLVALVFDGWNWKKSPSPRCIKLSFVGFHFCILLFGLLRAWEMLVLLTAHSATVVSAFVEPLSLFAIMLFISGFSCIVYNGSKAAFRLSKRVWYWHCALAVSNLVLWLLVLGTVVTFYARFKFSEKRKQNLEESELIYGDDQSVRRLFDATLCIVTFFQIFLAAACVVIMAASIRIVRASTASTKKKKKAYQTAKLFIAYSILVLFFTFRTVIDWVSVFLLHHYSEDLKWLILDFLIPDVVPILLIYAIEFLGWTKKLTSSTANVTSPRRSDTTQPISTHNESVSRASSGSSESV